MDVFEAMRERCSVRDYSPKPVTPEQLALLEEVALRAQTSLNLQQQKFYFITNPDILETMCRGVEAVSRERGEQDYLERLALRDGKVFFGAPLVVVIAVNRNNNYVDVDAGIAAQNLALAAKAIGLDSVIMAAPDRIFKGKYEQEYASLLGFPEDYRFGISIAIGYSNGKFTPHELKRENIVRIA